MDYIGQNKVESSGASSIRILENQMGKKMENAK